MVMELVTGETFEQLIDRSGPLPVERAASLTGNIFARGPRLWATIETADDLILRIEPQQQRPLLDIIAQRTKVKIRIRASSPGSCGYPDPARV